MAKKGKTVLVFDGKAAAAGEQGMDDTAIVIHGDEKVFDGPLDAEAAIAELIELNHERTECATRWENAKTEASDAKKELDNASNAISMLIDRIDRQRAGQESQQPRLRTLEAEANPASMA